MLCRHHLYLLGESDCFQRLTNAKTWSAKKEYDMCVLNFNTYIVPCNVCLQTLKMLKQ